MTDAPMNEMSTLKVLIRDTADNAADAFLNLLGDGRLSTAVQRVNDREELMKALAAQAWDVLLLNQAVEDVKAEECANWIRGHDSVAALVLLAQDAIDAARIAEAYAQGASALVSPEAPEYSVAAFRRECAALRERQQRRHLRRENAELLERCRLLLAASRDPIAYIHEGMHVYANAAYLELFGCADMDEAAGLPFVDLIAESHREALKEGFKRVRAGTETEVSLEVGARRSGGEEFTAALQLRPTRYEGEECLQVLVGEAQRNAAEVPPPAAAPEEAEACVPAASGASAVPVPDEPAAAPAEAAQKAAAENVPAEAAPADDVPAEAAPTEAAPQSKQAIAEALAAGRGELLSRPVIAVTDLEPEYHEIEARLQGQGGDQYGPEECRAALNSDPLGQKLDQWTVDRALRQMVELNNQGESPQFFFSLSARSMTDRKFPQWLAARAQQLGVDPQALGVNLHQADVLADPEAAQAAMEALRSAELKVCICGFSPGAQTLALVQQGRPAFVKLHPGISRKAAKEAHAAAQLKRAVAELHARGAKVIAPGVNDTTTLSALWKADVDLVQGDLLPAGDAMSPGKPVLGAEDERDEETPQRRVGT